MRSGTRQLRGSINRKTNKEIHHYQNFFILNLPVLILNPALGILID